MSSPLTHGGRGAVKAFTLIEMLSVITIIGILAGIVFAVARGVSGKGQEARAKAELGALASGMEEYRRYFGDYLHLNTTTEADTDDTEIDPTPEASEGDAPYNPKANTRYYNFFRALNGRINPDLQIVTRQISKTAVAQKYVRSFVNPSKFTLERSASTDAPSGLEPLPIPNTSPTADDKEFGNAYLDPWGNRYIYYYKDVKDPNTAKKWKRPGFLLLSAGPDGKVKFNIFGDREKGDVIDDSAAENKDNIYATP